MPDPRPSAADQQHGPLRIQGGGIVLVICLEKDSPSGNKRFNLSL
jgi:hypothetical protein